MVCELSNNSNQSQASVVRKKTKSLDPESYAFDQATFMQNKRLKEEAEQKQFTENLSKMLMQATSDRGFSFSEKRPSMGRYRSSRYASRRATENK